MNNWLSRSRPWRSQLGKALAVYGVVMLAWTALRAIGVPSPEEAPTLLTAIIALARTMKPSP